MSSSVRLTVCPWSGMPGRLGKESSHWDGLNTVTRLTRWKLATSWAKPIFCR